MLSLSNQPALPSASGVFCPVIPVIDLPRKNFSDLSNFFWRCAKRAMTPKKTPHTAATVWGIEDPASQMGLLALLALQQADRQLRLLVGLGQHATGRLLQHLVACQRSRFSSEVCIHDARLGGRYVLRNTF